MWTISKVFNFEMGHRVWAQKLEHEHLSLSTECACKHLHGHSYEIKVFLSSNVLDQSSMVTDFKNLNFVKKFLDETLDHKFMIDVNDPLFDKITGIDLGDHLIDDFTNLSDVFGNNDEFAQSFVLVNFCPTSENICKHLKEYIQHKIWGFATVSAVELWETKKSHCRYE